MPKQYTREELWKLYKKLPEGLREAVFSAESADHIGSTCDRHEISDKAPEVATQVGNVLLGLLMPEELEDALIKEVKLKKTTAQGVAREISRFVFYPVKAELDQLHGTHSVGPLLQKQAPAQVRQVASEDITQESVGVQEAAPPAKDRAPDPYHEDIDEEEDDDKIL